jgi:CheY-like chemotaxis protein/anti-sigma regulatory factor (Ser/Thr protein kinase)
LAPIVKETLKLLRASLPPGIALESDLDHEGGVVLADATTMHQVLMNLFTNAVHAMAGRQGVLEVNLRRVELARGEKALDEELPPGPYVLLSVRDTGQGMDAQTRERIFEPYFTTKGHGRGTGLGLAVVHGIVKSHGGAIAVESRPGQGSTFRVWLPLHEAEADAGQAAAAPGPLPRGAEGILLVEDEPEMAEAVRRGLEGLGYCVRALPNAEEALEVLAADPSAHDLLLTDLMLPGLDGAQLVERSRRLRPGLPAIVLTGYAGAQEIARLRGLGVEKVLLKPCALRQLAETVREVLDQPRFRDPGRRPLPPLI